MKNLPSDDFRVSIPDKYFQFHLLTQEGITVSQGTVAYGDIKGIINVIFFEQRHILDLEGIQYFTALKSLSCTNNQLTSLNVSKNTALKYLHCDGNKLTSLDVSKNTALTWLACESNQITSLDVRNNTALILSCDGNKNLLVIL